MSIIRNFIVFNKHVIKSTLCYSNRPLISSVRLFASGIIVFFAPLSNKSCCYARYLLKIISFNLYEITASKWISVFIYLECWVIYVNSFIPFMLCTRTVLIFQHSANYNYCNPVGLLYSLGRVEEGWNQKFNSGRSSQPCKGETKLDQNPRKKFSSTRTNSTIIWNPNAVEPRFCEFFYILKKKNPLKFPIDAC